MRLKVALLGLCFFFSILLICPASWAISLSFNPDTSSIGVGDTFDVDIVISDMQNDDLGAFDFNVSFDDSILEFDSYALGSGLGDIGLFEASDWSMGYLGSGTLNLSELSWLWDLSFQSDVFTLATISFIGESLGNSALGFSNVILGDAFGFGLDADLSGGSVDVAAPVPEPSTMLLLGTGLIGLFGASRRQKNN